MKFEHVINTPDVQGAGYGPGGSLTVSEAIMNGLARIEGRHKQREIRRGAGKDARTTRGRWTSRTGNTSRSFRINMKAAALEGVYASKAKNAAVVEFGTKEALGGPITPKRGRYLAIPLPAARSGVGGGMAPRDYPDKDLFPIRSKKGNLLLMRKKGKGMEPMFVLKRRVTLDYRGGLDRAIKHETPRVLRDIADAAMIDVADRITPTIGGINSRGA